MQDINPLFFDNPDQYVEWMELYHRTEKEIFVGMFKLKAKKKSISLMEATEIAICYGWVDSKVYSIDNERYCYRFTPRKNRSHWSEKNIEK